MTRHRLASMTTREAADAVRESPVVLLAVGAFEQHGPGLPLDTDLARAEAVCDRVAERLDGAAVVGPAVPVGLSPHHLGFAGTVSLSLATFTALVTEYVDGLHRHGWRKVLVVNGHGGNGPALAAVGQELLRTHPDLEYAWTPLTGLASDVVAGMGVSEVHGHSGEAETAQMLHLAPDSVRTARLAAGTTLLSELDGRARLSRRAGPAPTAGFDELTPNGVLGDPRRATAEQGHAIVDAIVDRLADLLTDWLKA